MFDFTRKTTSIFWLMFLTLAAVIGFGVYFVQKDKNKSVRPPLNNNTNNDSDEPGSDANDLEEPLDDDEGDEDEEL